MVLVVVIVVALVTLVARVLIEGKVLWSGVWCHGFPLVVTRESFKEQWFSTRGDFEAQRTFGNVWKHL